MTTYYVYCFSCRQEYAVGEGTARDDDGRQGQIAARKPECCGLCGEMRIGVYVEELPVVYPGGRY